MASWNGVGFAAERPIKANVRATMFSSRLHYFMNVLLTLRHGEGHTALQNWSIALCDFFEARPKDLEPPFDPAKS